eukprot:3644459-Rhodomonas_salina.1
MGWAGNTIHWGGQCHTRAQHSQCASIAWVLHSADHPHAPGLRPQPPPRRADTLLAQQCCVRRRGRNAALLQRQQGQRASCTGGCVGSGGLS